MPSPTETERQRRASFGERFFSGLEDLFRKPVNALLAPRMPTVGRYAGVPLDQLPSGAQRALSGETAPVAPVQPTPSPIPAPVPASVSSEDFYTSNPDQLLRDIEGFLGGAPTTRPTSLAEPSEGAPTPGPVETRNALPKNWVEYTDPQSGKRFLVDSLTGKLVELPGAEQEATNPFAQGPIFVTGADGRRYVNYGRGWEEYVSPEEASQRQQQQAQAAFQQQALLQMLENPTAYAVPLAYAAGQTPRASELTQIVLPDLAPGGALPIPPWIEALVGAFSGRPQPPEVTSLGPQVGPTSLLRQAQESLQRQHGAEPPLSEVEILSRFGIPGGAFGTAPVQAASEGAEAGQAVEATQPRQPMAVPIPYEAPRIGIPSMQTWSSLSPSEQQFLLGLVELYGMPREDFLRQMARLTPQGGDWSLRYAR